MRSCSKPNVYGVSVVSLCYCEKRISWPTFITFSEWQGVFIKHEKYFGWTPQLQERKKVLNVSYTAVYIFWGNPSHKKTHQQTTRKLQVSNLSLKQINNMPGDKTKQVKKNICAIPKKKRKHVSKHQLHSALAVFPKQEVQNFGSVQMVNYQMLMAIREGILKSDYYHSLWLFIMTSMIIKWFFFYLPTENKTTIYEEQL